MKVLIEIDEMLYNHMCRRNPEIMTVFDAYVSDGIPLNGTNGDVLKAVFEGMTNGEVLQAMFPNASVCEHGSTYSVNNVFNFNSTWWNADYKEGSEDV